MLDHAEFERWRTAAEDAARAARVQADAELHNWACFMAEQSAQLAMKALLHGIGAGAWGHDLVKLRGVISEATEGTLGGDVVAAVMRLSRHYIATRYPDAHAAGAPGAHYSREDSLEALADMQAIERSIDELWAKLVREESVQPDGNESGETEGEDSGSGG